MFKSRTLLLLVVALMLLSITVVACSGEGGASATSPAAQALIESARTKDAKEVAANSGAAATSTELNVAMASYSAEDLAGMTQATASTKDGDVTGASLLALLETAGVNADTIVLTASDGYAAEVAVSDLDDTAIIVVDDDGTFDSVIPTLATDKWVKDLVSITAK